jgi:hypothetical protein
MEQMVVELGLLHLIIQESSRRHPGYDTENSRGPSTFHRLNCGDLSGTASVQDSGIRSNRSELAG